MAVRTLVDATNDTVSRLLWKRDLKTLSILLDDVWDRLWDEEIPVILAWLTKSKAYACRTASWIRLRKAFLIRVDLEMGEDEVEYLRKLLAT